MNKTALTLMTLALSNIAVAAPLTAQQVLEQFNLVTLGSATSSSHVDGRSYIGGDLEGGDYAQHAERVTPSSYAGLTIAGSGSNNIHVNNLGAVVLKNLSDSTVQGSGTAAVSGNASNVTFNVPYYVEQTRTGGNANGAKLTGAPLTVDAATSTNFKSVLTGLSSSLSSLKSTGSTLDSNGYGKTTFHAIANAQGLAVFDLTTLAYKTIFKASSEYSFDYGTATTVIFNVDDSTLSLNANFIGGGAFKAATNTIWNFYKATDITISSQFGGTVLAPLAHLTNSSNIEGSVLVNTLTQNAEIHSNAFTGSVTAVPEPETYAMLVAGLGLMGLVARRRKLAA